MGIHTVPNRQKGSRKCIHTHATETTSTWLHYTYVCVYIDCTNTHG